MYGLQARSPRHRGFLPGSRLCRRVLPESSVNANRGITTRTSPFEAVRWPLWQIYAGSLLGYLCGQTLNAWIMVFREEGYQGRFLWLHDCLHPGRRAG